ncbi:DegV family protein [Micrococcoides hystricis]|uniref:DegV family protein n=1 Tax=Micrococcoides hystricis TaxID=1572761 RepID=A0ABV6P7K9_9MICC
MVAAEFTDGSLPQWLEGIRSELKKHRPSFQVLLRSLTKRNRIAVVTDSACALPPEIREIPGTEHLRIIPMPVMVDGQIYTEGVTGPGSELPVALATGKRIQTSRPAPGHIREVYQQLEREGYQHIISLHLSGRLSGTVDAAILAAEDVTIPVDVIDTRAAAMAQGYMVLDALLLIALGYNATEVTDFLDAEKKAQGAFFTVANLEALRRGGRINALSGLLGAILNVKPVLYLSDGAIQLAENTRSFDRALERISDLVTTTASSSPHRIAVHYFGDRTAAENLIKTFQPLSSLPVPLLPLPAVLAAHTGLGSIGVTLSPHQERKPA